MFKLRRVDGQEFQADNLLKLISLPSWEGDEFFGPDNIFLTPYDCITILEREGVDQDKARMLVFQHGIIVKKYPESAPVGVKHYFPSLVEAKVHYTKLKGFVYPTVIQFWHKKPQALQPGIPDLSACSILENGLVEVFATHGIYTKGEKYIVNLLENSCVRVHPFPPPPASPFEHIKIKIGLIPAKGHVNIIYSDVEDEDWLVDQLYAQVVSILSNRQCSYEIRVSGPLSKKMVETLKGSNIDAISDI